mgnify:CR=1 FL=1
MKQPTLPFWQVWNVSFGFLGVQLGFALQNANVSRVLSDLGADLHSLSLFWLAAPIMGLLVQPIVGAASDRTWNRVGRRRPYILGGAIAAAAGMLLMPNASLFVAFITPMLFGGLMLALSLPITAAVAMPLGLVVQQQRHVDALAATLGPAGLGFQHIALQLVHLFLGHLQFAHAAGVFGQRLVAPLFGQFHDHGQCLYAAHAVLPSGLWGRCWVRAGGVSACCRPCRLSPRVEASNMPCCRKRCRAGYRAMAWSVSGSEPGT